MRIRCEPWYILEKIKNKEKNMAFLGQKLFQYPKISVGIDLGDLSVKIVQLENNNNQSKILSMGSIAIARGAITDGEIHDSAAVASAIKRALSSAWPKKITIKKVICSVVDRKAFARIFSFKPKAGVKIEDSVRLHVEGILAGSLENFYYDWEMVNNAFAKKEGEISILITAVSRKAADSLAEVMKTAGLELAAIEIESVANSRSLISFSKNSKTMMVIDIGDRRTTLAIFKEGIPYCISSIPVSGQTMTMNIAGSLGISYDEAERMKLAHGVTSDISGDILLKILTPMMDTLGHEIGKSIDFFAKNFSSADTIDEIVLGGGGAAMKGLAEYLGKKTHRRVTLANPSVNVQTSPEELRIDRKTFVRYATAIGLALKQ